MYLPERGTTRAAHPPPLRTASADITRRINGEESRAIVSQGCGSPGLFVKFESTLTRVAPKG